MDAFLTKIHIKPVAIAEIYNSLCACIRYLSVSFLGLFVAIANFRLISIWDLCNSVFFFPFSLQNVRLLVQYVVPTRDGLAKIITKMHTTN